MIRLLNGYKKNELPPNSNLIQYVGPKKKREMSMDTQYLWKHSDVSNFSASRQNKHSFRVAFPCSDTVSLFCRGYSCERCINIYPAGMTEITFGCKSSSPGCKADATEGGEGGARQWLIKKNRITLWHAREWDSLVLVTNESFSLYFVLIVVFNSNVISLITSQGSFPLWSDHRQ